MLDDTARIHARLQQIEDAMEGMERRLRTLEAALPSAESAPGPPEAPGAGVPDHSTAGTERFDVPAVLSLVGRSFMVFGGAFLLRALTDSGRLPRGAGILLGLGYAAGWLVTTERVAARGRPLSGVFHGVTAVAIGLPLIVEATTRFALLSAWASAAALALFGGLALAVAWRRRLQGLAGVTTLGVIGAAVALSATTGQYIPFAIVLVLNGVAALWLSYDCDWFWLRWPSALAADVAVLALLTRATRPQPTERPGAVIGVQLLLLALYLGSFAARTLVRGRLVLPFEILQTVVVFAVGLGGALAVARASGIGMGALGAASMALGAGTYAAAFAFVGRRQGLGANLYFYASLALVLTLTGLAVLLGAAPLTLVLAGLAVLTTWLARRFGRRALTVHGAVYCAGAVGGSGLLAAAVTALAGPSQAQWPALAPAAWAALAAVAACLAVPRPSTGTESPAFAHSPRLLIALLAAIGAGGALVVTLGPALAGSPPDAGTLATVRTAVVAGAAVLLAACARTDRFAELGWLTYPVLLTGAAKLLVEDFRHSRPATLFLALALYGAALVVAPRLMKGGARGNRPDV
jgi:hypothetical protein